MAKLFNICIENDYYDKEYLGSYKAKTFDEAARQALEENGYNPKLYDKKTKLYASQYAVIEFGDEKCSTFQ